MILFNNHADAVTHFLILFLFGSLISATPIYTDTYCPNNATFQPTVTFQTNLKVLLSSLTSNATNAASTYDVSMGFGSNNAVNGLFLCRGDISPPTCQECVATAAEEITRRCPNQSVSIIWYDECMLRYTDRYFSPTSIVPRASLPDGKNISTSDLDSFNQTLFSLLMDLAAEAASSQTAKKFASGEAEFTGSSQQKMVYGLAQCASGMTNDQCESCLQNAIGTLPTCCGGKQGARALLAWCNIRYELYRFYTTSGTSDNSTALNL